LICWHVSFDDRLKLGENINSDYRLTDKKVIEFSVYLEKIRKIFAADRLLFALLDNLWSS